MSEVKIRQLEKKILKLYKEDEVYKAHSYLKKLRKLVKSKNSTSFKEHESFEIIDEIVERANFALKEIKDDTENWKQVSDRKDGIKTFFRQKDAPNLTFAKNDSKVASKSNIGLKMEGIIHSPIINILSIFYEIDLYPTWVFRMSHAKKIQEDNKFRFICFDKISCPFPIKNRYMILQAQALDLLETEGVLILCSSITEEELSKKYDASLLKGSLKKDDKPLLLNYCGILIKPLGKKKTKCTITCAFDLGMKSIPKIVVEICSKMVAPFMFKRIEKFANNVDKYEYGKRMKENKEVYWNIERRFKKFLNVESTKFDDLKKELDGVSQVVKKKARMIFRWEKENSKFRKEVDQNKKEITKIKQVIKKQYLAKKKITKKTNTTNKAIKEMCNLDDFKEEYVNSDILQVNKFNESILEMSVDDISDFFLLEKNEKPLKLLGLKVKPPIIDTSFVNDDKKGDSKTKDEIIREMKAKDKYIKQLEKKLFNIRYLTFENQK